MKKAGIYLLLFIATLKAQTLTDALTMEDSSRIRISRLSINTKQSDFSPVLINKELYFISGRPKNFGVVYEDENNNSEMTDIYTAAKKDSVNFKNVKNISSINSKYNEGPFTFNTKEEAIYFSGNEAKQKKGTPDLKIYSSKKIKGQWSKPQVLSFCLDGYSYCHPTISADGNMMLFCSNLKGGFGGMDLYMATFNNGQWSVPFNLGDKVNSSANELFPFLSEKKILFFSSDKKGGIGGLDLYSFNLDGAFESNVELLPEPINSIADDFGIWVDSTLESGYFSTNRLSEYSDDIYYFATVIPDFSDSKTPSVKNAFCYTFFEETTLTANDTANMMYEWNFGNGQKARSLKAKHCFDKPGDYPIQLNIVEKNSGEIFYSEATYTLNVPVPEQLYITCCDTIIAGKDLQINSESSLLKGYDISKMYWHFGDGKYNRGKRTKHNFKRSGVYTVELGVIARNQVTNKFEKFKIEKKVTVIDNI